MVKEILTTDTTFLLDSVFEWFLITLQKLHPARKRIWFYTSQS